MEQFREKIEEHGNYYERQGFSPVAARLMIYLFLHPDGEATFDDMVLYFGVSKSAVSNALKVLSAMEIITEKTKGGSRKRYFKATLERLFAPEAIIKQYRESRMILEDISKLRKKKDALAIELQTASEFMSAMEQAYPKLYDQVIKAKKN